MAVAGVIVVLAWVPYIELTSFKPLGFDIKKGGELSVWGILAVVLVYYAFRSAWEYYVDYRSWIDTYGARGTIMDQEADPRDFEPIRDARRVKSRRLKFKFWVLDVAPPALMFLVALVAAFQQVAPLVWPPA